MKGQKTMMRNFVLLEGEHDHSGSPKQGPLAAFDETLKGNDYFHIRRVYRGGSWSPTGNGISCRLGQAPAMLVALATYLAAQAEPAKGKRNGKSKPVETDTALDDAMMRAAAHHAEQVLG